MVTLLLENGLDKERGVDLPRPNSSELGARDWRWRGKGTKTGRRSNSNEVGGFPRNLDVVCLMVQISILIEQKHAAQLTFVGCIRD